MRGYQPGMLDELLASGEVLWSGAGAIGQSDGWVAFHPADTAPLTLPEPNPMELTEIQHAILATLGGGGGYFFRQLSTSESGAAELKSAHAELKSALWQLIWSGLVSGDTFAPVRALLSGATRTGRRSTPTHRQRRAPRLSRYSVASATSRDTDPAVGGRWSALPAPETDGTVRAHFQADLLLARYGVLTRGALAAEDPRNTACLRALGSIYERMRRWSHAAAILQRQVRETSDGPERLAALQQVDQQEAKQVEQQHCQCVGLPVHLLALAGAEQGPPHPALVVLGLDGDVRLEGGALGQLECHCRFSDGSETGRDPLRGAAGGGALARGIS